MTVPFSAGGIGKINAKLPFSIDKMSFIGWMGDLDLENKVETLKYLSKTLTTLRHELINPEDRVFFLQKLSELVEQFSQQLQETYKNNYFPFSEQNSNQLKLFANCETEIANNYAVLCEAKDLTFTNVLNQPQKALIIYGGIQAQAKVLLYQSLLYQKPEQGFWSLCFLFYTFAKQNNILDFELESHRSRFISVFKQILLFELSNIRQFNTGELFSIFHLLNKLSDHAELLNKVPDKKFKGIPCINLSVDAPPSLLNQDAQQEHSYLFYISSLNVIKQILDQFSNNNVLESCNKSTLLRLIKALTMNYQRNSERELIDEWLFASIGFDKVKAYVLETENLEQGKGNLAPVEIQNLNFDIQKIDTSKNKADIYRSERDAYVGLSTGSVILEDIKSSDIWLDNKDRAEQESKKTVVNTGLVDKSSTGFKLTLNGVATKVGDIIGIIISEIIVITIVRRIAKIQGNTLQVGVEIVGKNPEILHFGDSRNKKGVTALYLKGDDVESIIIGINDYQNEDVLFFDKKASFRVEKQLFMTSIVRHLKVRSENSI